MSITLSYKNQKKNSFLIKISGSKSESNRLLILQKLYSNLIIKNLSDSNDTIILKREISKTTGLVDVLDAGTAMRFLTAYFASKKEVNVTLTGSKRMQERPIQILVDALKSLGADIEYLKKEGFPPLKIKGKQLTGSKVAVNADISSQYISALLLIAPSLPKGLEIILQEEITSSPYIYMTLNLLKKTGISYGFSKNVIKVLPTKTIKNIIISVESDWSSASYFYSIVALSENLEITLSNFSKNSFQGDSELAIIYESLGVKTIFNTSEKSITLQKSKQQISNINLALNNTPDIAQTIAVTCFGLGVNCKLTGLKTLKIKETDRLLALKTELEKLGASVVITDSSIEVVSLKNIQTNIVINTYNDHRMAMAFAPLAIKTSLTIDNSKVVSKSYPAYWQDLKKIGFLIQ